MRRRLCGPFVALSLGLSIGCVDPAAEAGPPGPEEEGESTGEAELAATRVARAPLPIVLLHGSAGFDRIGPIEYFYDVADILDDDGQLVFTTAVDPLQLVEVRAEQLAEQIDAVLDATGADRLHLIAHSQGGLDARFLISSLGYGDRVATLTTISTPHRGSRVADIALGLLPGGAEEMLGFLIDLLAGSVVGREQDVIGMVDQLTERHAVTSFNPANLDDPRVAYYSVAGVTQASLFFNPFTTDLVDPLLLVGYLLLWPSGSNDGLVTVNSARHGTFLGTIPADHLDEVGQFFGGTAFAFDHGDFYRDLARFLTNPRARSPL